MNWIYALLSAFLTAVAGCPLIIPFLRRLKFGQSILEIGPAWHSSKQGTPTMGGIVIIAACAVALVVTGVNAEKLIVFSSAALFGCIGFVDDYIKIVQKRNLGLSAAQKFGAQAAVSLAIMLVLHMYRSETSLYVPLIKERLDLGFMYIPFSVFVILGVVNSVNLTDGLDGLAASVTAAVALFFAAAAAFMGAGAISVMMAAACGACLGFLIHNANPARLFMGDTGSLFLGGMIAVAATVLNLQLFLAICGIIYFIEACSVIIQVMVYKKTRRRVFKMAPIHHHFELSMWRENKIVSVFTVITAIMCLVAILLLRL